MNLPFRNAGLEGAQRRFCGGLTCGICGPRYAEELYSCVGCCLRKSRTCAITIAITKQPRGVLRVIYHPSHSAHVLLDADRPAHTHSLGQYGSDDDMSPDYQVCFYVCVPLIFSAIRHSASLNPPLPLISFEPSDLPSRPTKRLSSSLCDAEDQPGEDEDAPNEDDDE